MKKLLCALAALLLVASGSALAYTEPAQGNVWRAGLDNSMWASPGAACQYQFNQSGLGASGYTFTTDLVAGSSPTKYNCTQHKPGGYNDNVAFRDVLYVGSGTCKPGGVQSGGVCTYPDPPSCTAGTTQTAVYSFGYKLTEKTSSDMALPNIVNGCYVTVEKVIDCWSTPATPQGTPVYCKLTTRQTGVAAPGATNTTTDKAPNAPPAGTPTTPASPGISVGTGKSCPAGTTNIGTDSTGGVICAGSGTGTGSTTSSTTTNPTTTTTNPDGSQVKTESQVKTNADGSTTTTTTTTTTAANGTKSTSTSTVTSNTPTGTMGKPDPASEEQKDLCQKYPQLTICQNSTVSGSCAAVACTGDAIQCALLRTQAERNCRDKATEDEMKASPIYAKGSAVLTGNDPDASTLPTKANATSVAVPAFDSSGWLGGGACFPDKTFSVQGKTITLSFTNACQPLLVFRYVLMIISTLIAFRMFSGTILKDS